MTIAAMLLIALGIEALIGWPDGLYKKIGHPVVWIGAVIDRVDRELNIGGSSFRRIVGAGAALALILWMALLGAVVSWVLPDNLFGILVGGVLLWPFIAARSLHEHVEAVAEPLERDDLEAARMAVAQIVGRDPETLDANAIARASLESLSENASDGVVAPVFWGVVFGIPGIVAYKTINTLDSMIAHRTERFEAFGWGAAKLDDLANWIPARLTGALIALSSKARGTSFRTMMRDARLHRSPNAGWPEAAMAGALGVRLSGPRSYDGGATEDAWLNPVASDPTNEDIARGLRIYRRVIAMLAFGLLVLAVF